MELELLWVGKGRDKLLRDLTERYLTRLRRTLPVRVTHVPEAKGRRSTDEVMRLEAKHLRESLSRPASRQGGQRVVVAMDSRGDQPTSRGLADLLAKFRARGARTVTFVIGGDEGLAPDFVAEADHVLSLSHMTFTHELVRVVLLEQLYRAHAILSGHPYHRD